MFNRNWKAVKMVCYNYSGMFFFCFYFPISLKVLGNTTEKIQDKKSFLKEKNGYQSN